MYILPIDTIVEPEQPNLFQAPDSVLTISGSIFGKAGHPLPYTTQDDTWLIILLLACISAFALFMPRFIGIMVRQFKGLLYVQHSDNAYEEAADEMRLLTLFSFISCIALALAVCLCIIPEDIARFMPHSYLPTVALLSGGIMVLLLVRMGLYSLINLTFFGGKKNLHWMHFIFFLETLEGLFILPLVVVTIYLETSIEFLIIYALIVLFLNKILLIYKAWLIFFRKNDFFLQTFLYFCALEMVPMLAFARILQILIDENIIFF